jgi:hypothetical protein
VLWGDVAAIGAPSFVIVTVALRKCLPRGSLFGTAL